MLYGKAIFDYLSETYAVDNSIFIDDYAKALLPIMDFLQKEITTGTIALIQVVKDDYLFVVDAHQDFQVVKVSVPVGEGEPELTVVAEFDMLERDKSYGRE